MDEDAPQGQSSPSPSPAGKVLRTDPGQDQGGILREKKRLSPKQQQTNWHFFTPNNNRQPAAPQSARNASPRRDPKTDPRLESPRNPMLAAPSRHRKKGQQAQDFLAALKHHGADKGDKLYGDESKEDDQKQQEKRAFTFKNYDVEPEQGTDANQQGPPSPKKGTKAPADVKTDSDGKV